MILFRLLMSIKNRLISRLKKPKKTKAFDHQHYPIIYFKILLAALVILIMINSMKNKERLINSKGKVCLNHHFLVVQVATIQPKPRRNILEAWTKIHLCQALEMVKIKIMIIKCLIHLITKMIDSKSQEYKNYLLLKRKLIKEIQL